MNIHIKQPLAISEAGGKKTNEDFIFPLMNNANPYERLFMVCDGEGGKGAGDVASKLVALSFARFFSSTPPEGEVNEGYLSQALRTAEESLDAYREAHPESKDMATTLALLHLGDDAVTMAWVGNSRVYFYDESAGHLKVVGETEKAEGNPGRILIRGKAAPQTIHMHKVAAGDIAPGDLFYLATDGTEEYVGQSTLETLFKSDKKSDLNFLINEIKSLSQDFAQDNYACYLLEIEKVGAGKDAAAVLADDDAAHVVTSDTDNNGLIRTVVFGTIIAFILGLVGIAWWTSRKDTYGKFMAEGESLMENKDFRTAINRFDSAYYHAGDDEARQDQAVSKRAAAIARLASQNGGSYEIAEDLNISAQAYKDNGDAYYEAGNFAAAADAYRKAALVKARDSIADLELPMDRMATAYMKLGDELYEQPAKDCEGAVAFYEQALGVFEGNEADMPTDGVYAQTQARLATCNGMLGRKSALAVAQEAETSAGDGDSSTPAQSSRGLSPAAGDSKSTTKTTPKSQAQQPASLPSGANARVVGPASADTRVAARTMSAEQEAQMKKWLASGKRLFVKARDSKSEYEYRTSAENLENAAPLLDGAGAYMLGYMYHAGLGVEKDETKGLRYAQVAARKGWPAGQYLYGHMLLERSNKRDSLTARETLQAAADQNYLEAIKRLRTLGQ